MKSIRNSGLSALILLTVSLANLQAAPGPEGDEQLGKGELLVKESLLVDVPEAGEANYGSAPSPQNRAVIIPGVTPDSPIRVRFLEPVDALKAMGAVIGKRLVMTLTPEIKGAFAWKSPTELLFTPQSGALSDDRWVQMRISGKLPLKAGGESEVDVYRSWYTSNFLMGSKTAYERAVAGQPRFVAPLYSGTGQVGDGQLMLLFDQPVNPQEFSARMSALNRDTNTPVHIALTTPQTLFMDPEGLYDPSHVIKVSFSPMPADGTTLVVRIPTFNENKERVMVDLEVEVSRSFAWNALGLPPAAVPGNQRVVDLETSFNLDFTSRFDYELFIKSLNIEPRPLALDSWQDDLTSVQLSLTLAPSTVYRISLNKDFVDYLGNKLQSPLDITLRSNDLAPVLTIPQKPLTIENGANRLPLQVRNIKDLTVQTWFVDDPVQFSYLLAEAAGEDELSGQTDGLRKGAAVKSLKKVLPLNMFTSADFGMDLEPGLKLLEISAEGVGTLAGQHLVRWYPVQSTNLAVSTKLAFNGAFCWVTAIDSAKPVAGATVELVSADGAVFASATSSKDGTCGLFMQDFDTTAQLPLSVIVRSGKDKAVSRLVDAELSQAWQFNLPAVVEGIQAMPAALFTERGAYRPGDTVHIKAFVRPEKQLSGNDFNLEIRDPQGQRVQQANLTADEFRGLTLDVPLAAQAAVGEYVVYLTQGQYRSRTTFRVEEFRVPTFEVKVSTKDAAWNNGSMVTVEAVARYMHGSGMDGRDIVWRVYRQAEDFSLNSLPGYLFTQPRDPAFTGNFAMDEMVLNADSTAKFSFVPKADDAGGPFRYIVQAAVSDTDRQTYAGRFGRVVHPGKAYVGVRPPPRAVVFANEDLKVPFVVVNTDGMLLSGKKVEVWRDQLEHHTTVAVDEEGDSSTYNREVVQSVAIGTFTSTAAPQEISLKTPGAGSYEWRLVTRDENGNEAACSFPLTVSGDRPTAWPRFDRERIDLVLDKKIYSVGETARVVVQSPFKTATGLLTVESEGVIDSYPFVVNGNTPAVMVPVKAGYAPNVFVSAMLVRGRVHWAKDATQYETGAPMFRLGYARMEIDPASQRLAVAFDQATRTIRPGSDVDLSFTIKDAGGKAAAASAAVMVVDEAVLGLTDYKTPDPVALAYILRALGVRNASSLLDLPHSRRSRFEALFPGGDADDSGAMGDNGEIIRKLFKSTAYWNPAVPVGADGKARINFRMSDNLSTYRIMVVSADKSGRMGSGSSSIVTRLPLMVQPVLPRFVYPGDELSIEAKVFNGTEQDGKVSLAVSFEGFTPAAAATARNLDVRKSASAMSGWQGRVSGVGGSKLKVRYTASMGQYKDSVEVIIPVLSAGNKENLVTSANFQGSGELKLDLPAKRLPGSLAAEVVLSTTALTELKDSVQYLMQYPNGCIEQTTSTAYPLIVLKDLLPTIGVEVNMDDLKKFSEAGVKRVLSFQTTSGGLAYWPGSDEPHAFATAFGLTVLIEAKKRGYDIKDEALKRMGNYLEATLQKTEIAESIPHGNIADADTRALFVMTLGRLGRPQPGYIQQLWQNRAKMTGFGMSFLAVAIKEAPGDKSLLEPVLQEVRRLAKAERDEAWYEGDRKGGYSFDSPLRTHASSLVAYSGVGGAQADMSGKLLKGFLARRQGGMWGNTQENVFGIMGIYQMAGQSSGDPVKAISLTINGKNYTEKDLEATSKGVLRLKLSDAALAGQETVKVSVQSSQSLFVTVRAGFEVPLDDSFKRSRSNGFTYQRQYETLDGKKFTGSTLPLGEVIKVRLSVKLDRPLHYVAIDDKLPAGLEAMNANLATTEKIDMGALSDAAMRTLPTISYQEIRDHRVAFYVDEMLPGSYEFVYLAKAATPGSFLLPSGRAEAMYEPEIFGTTETSGIVIK